MGNVIFYKPCPLCEKYENLVLIEETGPGECEVMCTSCDHTFTAHFEVEQDAPE